MTPRLISTTVRTIVALLVASTSVLLGMGDELPINLVSVALAVGAAGVLLFGYRRAQAAAGIFLLGLPSVQHATDCYYWHGVHERGLWWPWASHPDESVGSIGSVVGQVADASSVALALFAAVLAFWVLRLKKVKRNAG